MANRISEIGAEIGKRMRRIQELKAARSEQRMERAELAREDRRLSRRSDRGNYLRGDLVGSNLSAADATLFNLQCEIDRLYGEVEALKEERSNLYDQRR